MGRGKRTDCFNHLCHFVNGINAFFRGSTVAWLTKSFYHNFGAAALANLQVQLASFANYYIVGVHGFADCPCSNPFKALLMYYTRYINFTCKLLFGVPCKISRSTAHGRQRPFHIAGAAPVDAPLVNLCSEGRICPLCRIADRHCIHMSIKQQLFAGAIALDATNKVSIVVHSNLVKSIFPHIVFQHRYHTLLFAGIAFLLYQCLTEFYDCVLTFFAQHTKFLLLVKKSLFSFQYISKAIFRGRFDICRPTQ